MTQGFEGSEQYRWGMLRYQARFAGGGICLTIALAAVTWTSTATLWPWAERVINGLAILCGLAAILLAWFGIYAVLLTANSKTVIEGASNAPLNDGRKVIRLKVINNGLPDQFRGRAWWVHDNLRMHHDPWDICWSQTSETTIPIDDERLINLVIADDKEYVRPVRPSFPQLEPHQDQKHAFTDNVYIELAIWRNGHRLPARSGWRFVYLNEQISLQRSDSVLPKASHRRT